MKNLITFLLYSLSVSALLGQANTESRLQILSAGITETTLQLDLSGIRQTAVATPQGQAVILSIDQGNPLLQKGDPNVPKFSTTLMIPNKGNMRVEVLSAEFDEYPGMEVAPSKGNLKRTVNPADVPFEYGPAYAQDRFFPGALAELQTPFILRDARGQALWIYPVQYNPVQKIVRVYRSITLRVYFTGGAGKNELPGGPLRPESRAFQQLYRQLFVNARTPVAERGGVQEPDKMLVIAQDELLTELEPLVAWKRQMGIHTTVTPVSEIGSASAADIYNYVKNYYAEHYITYLLLVGDEAAIEPEMRQDGDFYSCDNCFGYMSGDDHLPEILVGRLHANSPEQLRIMVNRNLEYEINPLIDPDQNWMATGMASASNEGLGYGDDGQADWQHGNEWKATHLADGYEKYWEFYDGSHGAESPTPGDPSADADGNPTNAPLVELINTRGVSIYNYTGHGWEQGLVSGNFNTDAVGSLRNSGRYPILIAVACCAGNFTNGECLGETWQRAGDPASGEPWGGIAGFFSSDYQSWSPPMEGQDGMNQYLADADGIQLSPTMAGMLAYGNARMIAAYGLGGEMMADFWNPFAEPSTVPRTRLPQTLAASHADSINFETLSLAVSCPVEGALVSLYWQEQTWAVATVENGMAVLEFAPLNNIGQMLVTVTQFNHIPYRGAITVKPATQPYVVSQQIEVDDSAGNNDQKVDFGESIVLNALLRNIGLGTATAVSAALATDNPLVTVTDGQAILGNLNSNGSAIATFAFSVRDDVPNGEKVEFTLTLFYNDTISYATTLVLTLYAPALEIGSWTIDDSINGNGNNRLENGETATLRILNRNNGGSNSPDVLATLTALTPYITVSDPVFLGSLDAATGEKAVFFYLSVAPNAPTSLLVNFHYALAAAAYGVEKTIGPLTINPIVETFETNNFASFNWELSGDKPWLITAANPYVGAYCTRSGTITHNQSSTMQINLLTLQDGIVSFARRVSSEADYDFLRFYIDGVEMGAWSGTVPWGEASFPVAAGQHLFTWSYEKDDLVSTGTDRAWVDEIVLPPHQIVVQTGSAQAGDLSVGVAPNPTTGQLTIRMELPTEQVLGIQVFDGPGRLVQTVQPPTRTPAGLFSRSLDLGAAAPGVYLVRILAGQSSQTVKVVLWRE